MRSYAFRRNCDTELNGTQMECHNEVIFLTGFWDTAKWNLPTLSWHTFRQFSIRSGCVPEHPSTFAQTMEELVATSYARHCDLSLETATQGTTTQIVGN